MATTDYSPNTVLEEGLCSLPEMLYGAIAIRRTPVYFIDVNPSYSGDRDPVLITEEFAIRGQIRNILSTPIGSEHFEPEYGSLIPYRLHELINDVTAWNIELDTLFAVRRWMADRISLLRNMCRVSVLDNDPDNEGYSVRLGYSINRTGQPASYEFKVIRS